HLRHFPGPLGSGEVETKRPVRGACRKHARFPQFRDELSKTPVPAHEPAKRERTRGVLSFGSVFFGQAKKMNSVAEGERKRLIGGRCPHHTPWLPSGATASRRTLDLAAYSAGRNSSVSAVANSGPPMMATAIGPKNTLRDSGIIASMAASAVSTMGRKRRTVASTMACQRVWPEDMSCSIWSI